MDNKEKGYGGHELFDILDKAADQGKKPSFIKKVLGSDLLEKLQQSELHRNLGGSAPRDPRSSIVKPTGLKYWTKFPASEEEQAIYYGVHIHTQDNPLGLHSHMPGGPLSGGHNHGPDNQYGEHYHGEELQHGHGRSLDGAHVHDPDANMPCGPHEHCPPNFG